MQNDLKPRASRARTSPSAPCSKSISRSSSSRSGACVFERVGFYAVLTYLPNYLETTLNYDPALASIITNIVLVVYIAFIFLSGRVSDRFGRKKMLIGACVGFIVLTIPAFMLLSTMNFVIILAVELVMCLMLTINDGTLASYLKRDVPHRCSLLRVRAQLQPGQRHLRRVGLLHFVLADQRNRQQHCSGVLHGVHRGYRAGCHDLVARAHREGSDRGVTAFQERSSTRRRRGAPGAGCGGVAVFAKHRALAGAQVWGCDAERKR